MKRMRASKGRLLSRRYRWKDNSEYGKMRAKKGHSRPREPKRSNTSGHGMNARQREALTNCRAQVETQIRECKECESARKTHLLDCQDKVTSQDKKRTRISEGHSQTGVPRGRDRSGREKNESQQGNLTA